MMNFKIAAECPHEETAIRVLESTTTCEKTAEFCLKCKKQLSEPKTEC
jgi:hypothetical protein